MSRNDDLVDRWHWRAQRARRARRPLRVTPVQRDELARLGSTAGSIYERHPDGTETAFGVPLEVR